MEARIEHIESLVKGHFDEDPDCAMTRAESAAIAIDSAKKASDAGELLRLEKKACKEDELQKSKAISQGDTPVEILLSRRDPRKPDRRCIGCIGSRGQDP